MNVETRHLTPSEYEHWSAFYDNLRRVKVAKCNMGKPILSQLVMSPTVLFLGINPGEDNEEETWTDPKDLYHQRGWIQRLINKRLGLTGRKDSNKFFDLICRCFAPDDLKVILSSDPHSFIWANLYPFRTTKAHELELVFEHIREQNKDMHPDRECRIAMLQTIYLLRPKIVLCAGKTVFNRLCSTFSSDDKTDKTVDYKAVSLPPGVFYKTYAKNGELVHIIGFSRLQSQGFWYDCRYKSKSQETALRNLTHSILNL